MIFIESSAKAGFFETHGEGWHWYQNPLIEAEVKPETKESEITVKSLAPTDIIKEYQKELEKKLHRAWVNPTQQNIKAYQEMQKDLMQRSQTFSQRWMEVVYRHPELDHTLVSPVNQKSRHIYLDQQKDSITQLIQALKNDYGLFFFFSSQCEYCHQFSPIVQQFSKQYGWEVVAISADGGTMPGFKEIVMDNGLVEKWQIKLLPALFAVQPKTGKVIPIAYGLTSLDEMETRIVALAPVSSYKDMR